MERMMSTRRPHFGLHLWISISIILFVQSHSFYLPGVAPEDFQKARGSFEGESEQIDLQKILKVCVSQVHASFVGFAVCCAGFVISDGVGFLDA
ncbi:hypothetical protein RHMOL_Rhmol03G0282800 [Rhododendron molle]|uniref:Uncharacterized protein n=1 Tax=Rhododendron molle TaxID=49168 RepID=A0ACC0PJ10_RHOML|nr:hypothetical protein RHMOL_Rhmol03G0282800 [Rhododendron molle]